MTDVDCCQQVALADVAMTWFCGERVRSKDDFNMKMYKDEVEVGDTQSVKYCKSSGMI